MQTLINLTFGALLAFATANAAFADANTPLKPPRVYTGIYQPKSTPTKASALAPRAGAKRHNYGAPIQSPILKMQPKKPTTPTSTAPK
jgi:hypothetical protein